MDAFHGLQETETHWSGDDARGPDKGPLLESFHGTVTFASGEVARCAGVETIFSTLPGEPCAGLLILVLPDGSTGWQSFDAPVAQRASDGALTGRGTWAWIAGTGAFAGLSGGGTITWRYAAPRWQARFEAGPAAV